MAGTEGATNAGSRHSDDGPSSFQALFSGERKLPAGASKEERDDEALISVANALAISSHSTGSGAGNRSPYIDASEEENQSSRSARTAATILAAAMSSDFPQDSAGQSDIVPAQGEASAASSILEKVLAAERADLPSESLESCSDEKLGGNASPTLADGQVSTPEASETKGDANRDDAGPDKSKEKPAGAGDKAPIEPPKHSDGAVEDGHDEVPLDMGAALPKVSRTESEHVDQATVPDDKAVSILVDAIMESPEDPELVARAMRSLRRISKTVRGRNLIGTSGCVQIIADSLKTFGKNEEVAATICMVIANVCYGSLSNKQKLRKCGGLDALVHVLNTLSSSYCVSYACLALRNVSNDCSENQVVLGGIGGVEGIAKVMHTHRDELELQMQATAAIANIACGSKTCQLRVRESGALESVVRLLKQFPEEKHLLEHCMIAIQNLCRGNDKNQQQVGSLGGVDEISATMKRFPKDPDVQARACAAIRYLAIDDENRKRLGLNGGVVNVVDAMRIVNIDGEGMCQVLKALANCTYDHAENKQTVVRAEGIDAAIRIATETKSGEVSESAMRVLRNLTDTSAEVREEMKQKGALKAAATAMRTFEGSVGVSEHAVAMMLNIFADGPVSEDILSAADRSMVADLLRERMQSFGSSTQLQKHGESVVSYLDAQDVSQAREGSHSHRNLVRKLSSISSIRAVFKRGRDPAAAGNR